MASDQTSGLPNTLLLRLGMGLFLALNTMAFSFFFYSQEAYQPVISPDQQPQYTMMASLFAYLLLFLCTAVIATLGTPVAIDMIERCRTVTDRWRAIDANVLILIGVWAAYGISVVHTLSGTGALYYDTAAMILVLVTLGHYLDSTARRRATQWAESLIDQTPTRAWTRRGHQIIDMPSDALAVGDEVRIRPGETAPVDGTVLEGQSHVDESVLTGESCPRAVGPGDAVLAGSIVIDGQLWVTVRWAGPDRIIARLKHLMEVARGCQPPIQRVADRMAATLIPVVIVVALGVLVFHAYHNRATIGLLDGLSVLLVSCPCALGLAAPLATCNALRRLQQVGVLVDSGVTLERAAAVKAVLFDKTGTLTTGQMTVRRIRTHEGISQNRSLSLAAAIEAGSVHPIATALVEHAAALKITPLQASAVRVLPGVGVEAVIDGQRYRIGNAHVLNQNPNDLDTTDHRVYLTDLRQELACFWLGQHIRPDARQTIESLRAMNLNVQVLTGDQPGPAQEIGHALGVSVHSQLLPSDKLALLQRLRTSVNGRVAMVGDGINDGPVLAAADVGIAMVNATDLARQAGHVCLLSDRLDRIPLLLAGSRHMLRRIRLNLFWAFGYNMIGVALAAVGYLNPIFAASAMIASSFLVVTTSAGAGNCAEHAIE